MRVLITGASGHLGANLCRAAIAEGWTVRAMVRDTSDTRGIDGLDVEIAYGDLLDPRSLDNACADIEVVLHAAAVYRNWAPDDDDIIRPAVEGTENVLRAAKKAGVRRVVVTSSIAAVGYPELGKTLDETHWFEAPSSAYIRGKTEAEHCAHALAKELEIEVVACLPGGILGPWDYRITPAMKSAVDLSSGGPSIVDLCMTHVEDVARGHILAASEGRPGERYLLTGDNVSKEQLAEMLTEITGVKVGAMTPPRLVIWLISLFEVLKARVMGGDAGITPRQVSDVYGHALWYDSSKAKNELGWTARPAREVVLDALSWLAVRGELKAAVADKVTALRPPEASWSA